MVSGPNVTAIFAVTCASFHPPIFPLVCMSLRGDSSILGRLYSTVVLEDFLLFLLKMANLLLLLPWVIFTPFIQISTFLNVLPRSIELNTQALEKEKEDQKRVPWVARNSAFQLARRRDYQAKKMWSLLHWRRKDW